MTNRFVRRAVDRLRAPSSDILIEIAAAPPTMAEHDRLASAAGIFDALEAGGTGVGSPLGGSIRVAAWNGERVKYAEGSADLVRRSGADVLFLTETDVGMARSGNRHTAAELAGALGMTYAFGVEFLELGLGDEREQAELAGARNELGFHGNALLAKAPILDPFVLRLDEGGVWWREVSKGQKRLGWRMAVGGWIALGGTRVLVASVHLESKTDPADRARQTERLVGCLMEAAGSAPILIGGDFNTNTLSMETAGDWFERPEAHEPMFEVLGAAGFEWRDANLAATTQRPSRTSTPRTPHRRLDWLFHRGLVASAPADLPALDTDGEALSDHDLVAASFELR
ncbi:endonuclease/exonuclease/phosphatase family protein [Aureimonas leprariae]|uniref:Endonuclease/exonuclease/phosphatase family protein n=1 Tax=Plantimonas leprariae TaxID=2615207 RepID=A0A7V7PQ22_9HYPH|nr:endonuclease/exonuclease/phosphatase family protein [Aureimonas leprariae]KAB0680197.1 endonuclease/exonuclease/phosphatase family protein [Aureimonas leprariae]